MTRKPLTLNNFNHWPLWAKIGLPVLWFTLLYLTVDRLDLQPLRQQLIQITQANQALHLTLQQQIQANQQLHNLPHQLTWLIAYTKNTPIPTTLSLPTVIETINQAANLAGLHLQQLTPQKPENATLFLTQAITLQATGHYTEFIKWLIALSQSSAGISLHLLTLSLADPTDTTLSDDPLLAIQATLWAQATNSHLTATHPSDFTPSVFIPYPTFADMNQRNPFSLHDQNPLLAYSLHDLNYIGMLAQETQIWGLVSTPKGQIYRVMVGDLIGTEHAQIMHIAVDHLLMVESVLDKSGNAVLQKVTLEMQ